MYPFDNEEETPARDLVVDDASSTLRATAELFDRSAEVAADVSKREMLVEYAMRWQSSRTAM